MSSNPFPRPWNRLDLHDPAGCALLKNEYFPLSNAPAVPGYPGLGGNVVLIAGRERIGGKSVLSHKILHEYGQGNPDGINFYPVDITIADKEEKKKAIDDDRYCLRRAVKEANRRNLIGEDEAESIGREESWRDMSESFREALGNDAVIMRMPKSDESLTPKAIADYVAYYAGSARVLGRSCYLYEYSYVDDREWQDLRDSLDRARLENLRPIEARPLLVDDAMRFIEGRIARCGRDPGIIDTDRTRMFLEGKTVAGTAGLDIDIGGVGHVMHLAFQQSENGGNEGLLHTYIVENYTRYMAWRNFPPDGGAGGGP